MTQKHLFIMGVADAGPTRLWRLLRSDHRLGLGKLRFQSHSWRDWTLHPSLYEKERFFDTRDDDPMDAATLDDPNGYFDGLKDTYGECVYVGDTLPLAFLQQDKLVESFPGAKILLMVRNVFDVVAECEIKAGAKGKPVEDHVQGTIRQWNRAIRFALYPPRGIEVMPVIYEDLFMNGKGLQDIYGFLGLPMEEDVALKMVSVLEYLDEMVPDKAPVPSMGFEKIGELSAISGYKAVLEQHANT